MIAACVRGERDAERELFRREYRRVHALLYRILGTTRELEDLAQEVFIAIFQALPRFRGDAKLRTWIDRIAVYTALDHIKARKRIPVPVETVFERPDPSGGSDERAHAREGLRRLYAVLATLKPEARIAFALYAIDGRSIADVAAITGVTALTAKLRIWRARREVVGQLQHDPILASYIDHHRGQP
ncbi:MAG TPA: RNA polymerase sigma factor [Kofleriaceae bacterium]|nr:RNA polymerase sigma factor [Kofleriaceae bacterium]